MVETRRKKQGLKLEVFVPRSSNKNKQKVSIDELNQIASELMVAYDETEDDECDYNSEPTFSEPARKETEVSPQYWNGLLSLSTDLLSNILLGLGIQTCRESQEPYTLMYQLLCDVNNPNWKLFDSLNALLSDSSTAEHFQRVCSNKELVNVLATACQNRPQA